MFPSPDADTTVGSAARRVLVVDDEPTLRLGFAYALANHSTEVETAGTGNQALEKMQSGTFDIIVLDLRMPDIDGLGVIERLRRGGSRVPVVLCSAALTPAAVVRAIQCHVVDFLMKPVRPGDLRSIISFVLDPGEGAYYLAMRAARQGRFEDSIHLLHDSGRSTDSRIGAWLELLMLMRHYEEDDLERINFRLGTGLLGQLAFRAPSP